MHLQKGTFFMNNSRNDNKTYSIYSSILKGTPFEEQTDNVSYIPYSENTSVLAQKMPIGRGKTVKNRICYQPMEGQDGDGNGTPTDLTIDRYLSFARGGAGLIWVEAVAVSTEGKSNPYQLELSDSNADVFADLVNRVKQEGLKSTGAEPTVIMQMTHSGRYSKPNGFPEPIAAYINPDIDKEKIPAVASDDFLDALPDKYAHSAKLAESCGFDGVDIKCCHGYLLSELLSAFDRPGKYGGDLAGRSKLLKDVACAVDATLKPGTVRASRLNVFDGYPGKYCFGKSADSMYDLSEPNKVIDMLEKHGVTLLNVTMGSPYRNPDVSRPYRRGLDMPKTNAIYALSRIFSGAAEVKKAHPSLAVVDTGISALADLAHFAAAGLVSEGMTDFVGFGRMSFAYPALAKDILDGCFDTKKVCVACGGCSYLKKNVQKSGCIIRNRFYTDVYKEFKAEHAD